MIENDKEFKNAFKKYLKSEGIEGNETYFCGTMQCDDCVLKDVSYGLSDIDEVPCSGTPFKEIEKNEKKIALLRKEISIMKKWKKESDLKKKLKDFCETFRQGNWNDNIVFSCCGIDCDDCLFNNIDNFKEWARQAKAKGEVKRDD